MWAKIAHVESCDSTTLEINCTIHYLGWNTKSTWPCNFKAVPKTNERHICSSWHLFCNTQSRSTLGRQTEALIWLQTAPAGWGTILKTVIVLSMDQLRNRDISAAINWPHKQPGGLWEISTAVLSWTPLLKVPRRMENVYQPHCWDITNSHKEITELRSWKGTEFSWSQSSRALITHSPWQDKPN